MPISRGKIAVINAIYCQEELFPFDQDMHIIAY